jgi:hypothetical protein
MALWNRQVAFWIMLLIGLQTTPFSGGIITDCSGLESQRSLDIDKVSPSSLSLSLSYCSHLEHRTSVKRFVSLRFHNLGQPVGLLGRGISPSQAATYRNTEQTQTNIHASSGIRIHDPSVPAGVDSTRFIPRDHCHRQMLTLIG